MTGPAVVLGQDVRDQLRDVVMKNDPDPIVIAVVTGSAERGLALSVWTAFEGPDAEHTAYNLLEYTFHAEEQ